MITIHCVYYEIVKKKRRMKLSLCRQGGHIWWQQEETSDRSQVSVQQPRQRATTNTPAVLCMTWFLDLLYSKLFLPAQRFRQSSHVSSKQVQGGLAPCGRSWPICKHAQALPFNHTQLGQRSQSEPSCFHSMGTQTARVSSPACVCFVEIPGVELRWAKQHFILRFFVGLSHQ